MQLKSHDFKGERSLPASAKRILSIITLQALMVSSSDEGESNEFTLVLTKAHYETSFPSLTQKRLQELLLVLLKATFSELKLGYQDLPILIDGASSNGDGSVNLTVSRDYMDCLFKLGCLPA